MQDILTEIADDELPALAKLYERNPDGIPYMVPLVHTGIRWKKSAKYRTWIKFLSPNNCWERDGTVITLVMLGCLDIFVATLDKECCNLYRGLLQTNLIDYKHKRPQFYSVPEHLVPTIERVINEKNLQLSFRILCCRFSVPPEEAKKYNTAVSSEVYVKELHTSATKQINEAWPYKFSGSEEYLGRHIEAAGGYGVFLQSNNELVAWVLRQMYGNMIMLQCEKQHSRKGYASMAIKALAKKIAQEGYWPSSSVVVTNQSSINLFEKLGFQHQGFCRYYVIE